MVGTRRENLKVALKGGLIRANVELAPRSHLKLFVRHLHEVGVTWVMDVGANEGQFARLIRAAGFRGQITSYEPMRRESGIIRQKSSGDPNWDVVHAALGAEPGTSTINVSANSYSSSLLSVADRHVAAEPNSVTTRQEQIEVRTLAAEVQRLNLDPSRTLLKVDTQGYELEVLKGGGRVLSQFAALQLEMSLVPLYGGAPVFDELYAWLRERGWRMWSLEPGFSGPTGEMLQCDGVFVRASAG